MARNWSGIESSQESLIKLVKLRHKIGNMMNKEIKENEVYDSLKDIVISVKDLPSTSLGRIQKQLNAMYKATPPERDDIRTYILKQKQLVEHEQTLRFDTNTKGKAAR